MTTINELIQIDFRKNKNNKENVYILVYNQYVFFFDESDTDKSSFSKILDILEKDNHPILKNEYLLKDLKKEDNVYSFISSLAENSSDFIGANLRDGELILISSTENINPISSIQLKKLVNLIKPKKISYTNYNDDYKTVTRKKILGGIPDKFYHGTSSDKINSILKYGLDKKFFSGSNFEKQNIYHEDVIFLNALFDNAIFYAKNASNNSGDASSFPVIIELEIPDKNLLVPDYDAEFSSVNKQYYLDIMNFDTKSEPETKKSGFRVSKEMGKWGYRGRIPPKFIKWLWIFDTIDKKWKKMKPDTWLKLTNKYDMYDIRYILRTDQDLY